MNVPRTALKKRYQWLAQLIRKHSFSVGAEVGAATGNTTKHILDFCKGIKTLYVVDDWRPIPDSTWDRHDLKDIFLRKVGKNTKLRILEGLSWEMAEAVPDNSLDFVFIDASHDKESVLKDLEAWIPKLKAGGMLTGHDLHFDGVVQALEEMGINYFESGVDNCWYAHGYDLYKAEVVR